MLVPDPDGLVHGALRWLNSTHETLCTFWIPLGDTVMAQARCRWARAAMPSIAGGHYGALTRRMRYRLA